MLIVMFVYFQAMRHAGKEPFPTIMADCVKAEGKASSLSVTILYFN